MLVKEYPSEGNPYRLMYVHTRLAGYRSEIDVTVYSLTSTRAYDYEGVKVLPVLPGTRFDQYDVVIVHAPFREHIKALEEHDGPLVVFLHGYEALKRASYYPAPYRWQHIARLAWQFRPVKDFEQLRRLRRFLCRHADHLHVIAVSEWMKRHAKNSLALQDPTFPISVIPNSVNPVFEQREYDWHAPKKWDFITIRPFDKPKYAVDIVVRCAERNPHISFLLIGEGDFFNHVACPPNLEIRRGFVVPEEIPDLLDSSRMALLPTRLDSQGVLACECAQYGIPLVSSDIEVCREFLSSFPQVALLPNDEMPRFLEGVLHDIKPVTRELNLRYSLKETVKDEMEIIRTHVESLQSVT